MPHKKNPVLTENLTGLARLVRMAVVPAMENVALWHERDISHSSVERTSARTPPSPWISRWTSDRVIDKLVIYPDNMLANMNKFRGLVMSQRVLAGADTGRGQPRRQLQVGPEKRDEGLGARR